MHVACRRVRALPGAQGRVAPTPVRALGKMRYGDILDCNGALQGGPLLHWNSGVSNFEELASAGLGVLGVHEGEKAQWHSHAPPLPFPISASFSAHFSSSELRVSTAASVASVLGAVA